MKDFTNPKYFGRTLALGMASIVATGALLTACGSGRTGQYETIYVGPGNVMSYTMLPGYSASYVPYDYWYGHQSVFVSGHTISQTVINQAGATKALPKSGKVYTGSGSSQKVASVKGGKLTAPKVAGGSGSSGAVKPKGYSSNSGGTKQKSYQAPKAPAYKAPAYRAPAPKSYRK